jgi:hypothetical protein
MSIKVELSLAYFLGMAFLTALWGLGLILHFFVNNRVFPKIIDDEGITTRSGKRHLWKDLRDWERHRLVLGGPGGPRITGNITLLFSGGKVLIGSFPIENLKEALTFRTAKLNATAIPG